MDLRPIVPPADADLGGGFVPNTDGLPEDLVALVEAT